MTAKWTINCLGTTWWSWPPNDLPTFWVTFLAAVVALWYLILTSKLLKATSKGVDNAWKSNQAGLLKAILEEYVTMAPDIEKVRQWWERDPSTAIQRYESGLRAPNGPNEATEMGDSRRKVSQYFLRVRALCQKEMLDADLVATTLGAEPVQVFLLYVDPLDEGSVQGRW